jgi:cell wall-associated NlpC family hydrolase
VTSPKNNARRNAAKVAALLIVLVTLAGIITQTSARAEQLASERAQASTIAAQIAALGQQEDGLSEQYDFGVQKLAQAQARVESATRAFQQAKHEQAKTIALLQLDAVQAYVGGGPEVALSTPAPVQSVDQALLRQELEQTFAADQTSALDGYQLAEADASTARVRLIAARQADSLQLSRLGRERRQVQAAQDKLIALEQQVKGRIAALVAEIQRQQILAEQRAEAARLARLRAEEAAAAAAQAARARREAALEAAAATTTTTTVAPATTTTVAPAATTTTVAPATTTTVAPAATTTTVAPVATTTAVPPTTASAQSTTSAGATPVPGQSPAAAIAVQAALSRVGDPYVWGAAGPSAFDCSGLVMWAYAQAGVYLPHYSGSQYADTIHIPMSDLQPGDLVFPANPGQHVAMYIGNGEIVQAPYTGADVQVVPLTSFFVLASQVG